MMNLMTPFIFNRNSKIIQKNWCILIRIENLAKEFDSKYRPNNTPMHRIAQKNGELFEFQRNFWKYFCSQLIFGHCCVLHPRTYTPCACNIRCPLLTASPIKPLLSLCLLLLVSWCCVRLFLFSSITRCICSSKLICLSHSLCFFTPSLAFSFFPFIYLLHFAMQRCHTSCIHPTENIPHHIRKVQRKYNSFSYSLLHCWLRKM